MQDFFLIVTRPAGLESVCIEASLETGHFPEKVEVETPPVEYETSQEDFVVAVHANSGAVIGETVNIQDDPASLHTIGQGWIIDRSRGDAGHPGVQELAIRDNEQGRTSLRSHNYQATGDTTVQISGTIQGAAFWGPGAWFDRT